MQRKLSEDVKQLGEFYSKEWQSNKCWMNANPIFHVTRVSGYGGREERHNSERGFECQCTRVIRTLLEANEQMQACETVSVAYANFSRFRALVKTSATAVE